jgi:branched-chain amino acid transport system substrate-binding protein
VWAAEIWQSYVNNNGGLLGRNITFVSYDTRARPDIAQDAMIKLITLNRVIAVVGEQHSAAATAEVTVAHQYGIPLILTDASRDIFTELGYPEVFRVNPCNSATVLADVGVVKLLIQKTNAKNVLFITENSDYAQEHFKTLLPSIMQLGVTLTHETVDSTATDFTPMLLKAKSATPGYQVILEDSVEPAGSLIVKQASEVGLWSSSGSSVKGWMSWHAAYPTFWRVVGNAGLYITLEVSAGPQLGLTPLGKTLVDMFTKEFGSAPHYSAYNMWDGLIALTAAIRSAGSTDPKKIEAALETVHTDGATKAFPVQFNSDPSLKYPNGTTQWAYHSTGKNFIYLQYQQLNQPFDQAPIVSPESIKQADLLLPP